MRPRGESSSWETGLGVQGGGPQGDAPGVWALTQLPGCVWRAPDPALGAAALPCPCQPSGRGEGEGRREGGGKSSQAQATHHKAEREAGCEAGGHLQRPGGTALCPAAGTGAAPGISAWPQVMHQPREVPPGPACPQRVTAGLCWGLWGPPLQGDRGDGMLRVGVARCERGSLRGRTGSCWLWAPWCPHVTVSDRQSPFWGHPLGTPGAPRVDSHPRAVAGGARASSPRAAAASSSPSWKGT